MKLVVQRVKRGEVKVDSKIVGKINAGLFVLVGIKKSDSLENADYLADKLLKLRVMADQGGKMNRSVTDSKTDILVVSQFTLYASTEGGNRPSFIDAEDPGKAEAIYEYFVKKLKQNNIAVATGGFGKYMEIDVRLDGPVTITLEK